jgi:Ni/Fe-hydrogenase b-type cytochrome subunit
MFFGVSFGVTVHAIARKVASSRRGPDQHTYHKEYIYDAYERLWHWLQASSIIILLITGLIIHKPHFFSIFSFAYMVEVHNIVGFILFANAALALFYNLASGEIKQYIPEPKGFIGRSMEQAMYYSKGVFKGESHPIEKSREQKMNPLQQVTYLAILNILLPGQIITGVLIWGAQRWPEISDSLGGLAFLGPVHTFLAWAFATFIVMHVYLTTHGRTPTSGIKSMISGWDEVEDHPGKSK